MNIKIPAAELSLYFFIWISINIYAISVLIKSQTEIAESDTFTYQSISDLEPGWFSRYKDVSDIEWSTWKFYIHISWFYILIQFIISEIIRSYKPELLKQWYILSSITFVCTCLGYKQMIIILIQPVIYASIICLGGKKTSIWFISILLLLSYNSLKYKYFFWNFLEHRDMHDEEVYLILFSMAWIELRCISYSIDFLENKDKSKMKIDDLIDFLSYVLYLPLLYMGPIILYEEFDKSYKIQKNSLRPKLLRFLPDVILLILYTFLLDLSFHYIYFYAMQNNIELVKKLPTLALCGGGLWMGLEFHLKYVISYGTTVAFARLDNIEGPPTPRCIARIHVYSQMWRHFDVGLYRFLVKYIYKPSFVFINKSMQLPKIVYKLSASFGTFFFIFLWHGMVWHIMIWSLLNFAGITLEYLGKLISKHHNYIWFKENVLKTEAMETRLIAVLCTPLLALSAVSNFYLFAGNEVGNLYFQYFFNPTSIINCIVLCISLYSCCQVSIALEDIPSRSFISFLEKSHLS